MEDIVRVGGRYFALRDKRDAQVVKILKRHYTWDVNYILLSMLGALGVSIVALVVLSIVFDVMLTPLVFLLAPLIGVPLGVWWQRRDARVLQGDRALEVPEDVYLQFHKTYDTRQTEWRDDELSLYYGTIKMVLRDRKEVSESRDESLQEKERQLMHKRVKEVVDAELNSRDIKNESLREYFDRELGEE